MKSTFKIGNIEINGVKVENIEFTQEYNVSEAISMVNFGKKFMTELLDESPALLESLERVFNKFNEIDNRIEFAEKKVRIEESMLLSKIDRYIDLAVQYEYEGKDSIAKQFLTEAKDMYIGLTVIDPKIELRLKNVNSILNGNKMQTKVQKTDICVCGCDHPLECLCY